MAFPTTTYTDNESAGSGLVSQSAAAGLDLSGLQPIAQLQSAVANLMQGTPATDALSLANGAYLTGLTSTAVSKRLIGISAGNVLGIDVDAVGAVFGGNITSPATIGTSGDLAYFVVKNTANAIVNAMSTVKAWTGSGSNVTDGAFASAGGFWWYTNSSVTTVALKLDTSSGLTGAGKIVSVAPTGGIGYATGAGGAVVQATNATTAVVLSTVTGQITTVAQNIAHGTAITFTVTNTAVAIGDIPHVAIQSGSNSGNTVVSVPTVRAGSFDIMISNCGLVTAETGTLIVNFALIKGVSA